MKSPPHLASLLPHFDLEADAAVLQSDDEDRADEVDALGGLPGVDTTPENQARLVSRAPRRHDDTTWKDTLPDGVRVRETMTTSRPRHPNLRLISGSRSL